MIDKTNLIILLHLYQKLLNLDPTVSEEVDLLSNVQFTKVEIGAMNNIEHQLTDRARTDKEFIDFINIYFINSNLLDVNYLTKLYNISSQPNISSEDLINLINEEVSFSSEVNNFEYLTLLINAAIRIKDNNALEAAINKLESI